MRAMLCSCRRHLEAPDEERLTREVFAHLRREHPFVDLDREQISEAVAKLSYPYDCVEVYAGSIEPDKE